MRPSWSWSPTRRSLGATRCSGRAGSNRRTRRRRARPWTLTSPSWRRATTWCTCSTASGAMSGLQVLPMGAGHQADRRAGRERPRRPGMPGHRICAGRPRAAAAQAVCAGDRGAPGQQVCGHGQGAAAAQHAGRHALGQGQGPGRTGGAGRRQRPARHPGRARIAAGPLLRAGRAVAARVRERLHLRGNARPGCAPSSRRRPTWNGPSRWTG